MRQWFHDSTPLDSRLSLDSLTVWSFRMSWNFILENYIHLWQVFIGEVLLGARVFQGLCSRKAVQMGAFLPTFVQQGKPEAFFNEVALGKP